MYTCRQSNCTSPACSLFTSADFNSALDEYVATISLRPRLLTLDTVDCSIKLYATFRRVIAGYNLFTLARSQYRVPKLSTPEATRLRHHFTDCSLRTLDDEETSRLWRGFLLYELTCFMHGVPQMMAAASNQPYHSPDSEELRDMSKSFYEMPTYIREEVMCVKQYAQEQYDLAFNSLVESFEVAVGEVGCQTLEVLPPPTDDTMPIVYLEWEKFQSPLQYLFEPDFYNCNMWTINMAALGVSVLQEFVSWDVSTRLDFIRATYPFLTNSDDCPIQHFLRHPGHGEDVNVDDLLAKDFGWSETFLNDLTETHSVNDMTQVRLRAVGWIFWCNRDRLFFMNLVENEVDESYDCDGQVYCDLKVQGRPHLLEKVVKIQEWEPIVQYFGPSFSESQLNNMKGLFRSMRNLNSAGVAEIVTTLPSQNKAGVPAEAKQGSG